MAEVTKSDIGQYKAGDTVRFKDTENTRTWAQETGKSAIGQIHRLTFNESYTLNLLKTDDGLWTTDCNKYHSNFRKGDIELCFPESPQDPKPAKFKIGDRVKMVTGGYLQFRPLNPCSSGYRGVKSSSFGGYDGPIVDAVWANNEWWYQTKKNYNYGNEDSWVLDEPTPKFDIGTTVWIQKGGRQGYGPGCSLNGTIRSDSRAGKEFTITGRDFQNGVWWYKGDGFSNWFLEDALTTHRPETNISEDGLEKWEDGAALIKDRKLFNAKFGTPSGEVDYGIAFTGSYPEISPQKAQPSSDEIVYITKSKNKRKLLTF